ncbi:peptidoglycan-binding domain-containing protein [Streptomyces aurantiacus]|uniref:peptidoglycan-binding domain-containing protein n=1 Tax=Streptomyces aurantiacus TaxID=47760 RepID=UPI0036D247B7
MDATTRLTHATALPHPADTQLFEPDPADFSDAPVENTSSRRRRFVLVGAGATAVVVAAAGFASGLFSYESPSRNDAAPDDIRASVPDTSVDEPPLPSDSESPSESASPSSSASSSTSASPSATESTASATPSRTTATTPRASTGGNEDSPDDPPEPSPSPTDKAEPVVLRPGDEGPEVTELQLRLKQLGIYLGNADGDYDNGTRNSVRNYQFANGINENLGIYDQRTRESLESKTSEP